MDEVAEKLAVAADLTRTMAECSACVEQSSKARAKVVAELRAVGVSVVDIERATGASRAALLRHQGKG